SARWRCVAGSSPSTRSASSSRTGASCRAHEPGAFDHDEWPVRPCPARAVASPAVGRSRGARSDPAHRRIGPRGLRAWPGMARAAADALQSEMELDADTGTWLWVQNLYGRPPVRYIGAGHGFAGNAYPFLRAAALLPADQVALVAERALATLQATARHADGG